MPSIPSSLLLSSQCVVSMISTSVLERLSLKYWHHHSRVNAAAGGLVLTLYVCPHCNSRTVFRMNIILHIVITEYPDWKQNVEPAPSACSGCVNVGVDPHAGSHQLRKPTREAHEDLPYIYNEHWNRTMAPPDLSQNTPPSTVLWEMLPVIWQSRAIRLVTDVMVLKSLS